MYLLNCTEYWRFPTEGQEDVGQLEVEGEAAVLDGQLEQLKPGVTNLFLVIILASSSSLATRTLLRWKKTSHFKNTSTLFS